MKIIYMTCNVRSHKTIWQRHSDRTMLGVSTAYLYLQSPFQKYKHENKKNYNKGTTLQKYGADTDDFVVRSF